MDGSSRSEVALRRLGDAEHEALYKELPLSHVTEQLNRYRDAATREAFWSAFRLVLTAWPPSQLPQALAEYLTMLLPELPNASIWHVRWSDRFKWRQAIVRPLLASEHLPEVFDLPQEDFQGINSGKGLQGTGGYGIGPRLDPALAICAPWVLGLSANRVGGAVVLLFGTVEAGRHEGVYGELIELLRPELFSADELSTGAQPMMSPTDQVALLRWWVDGLNNLAAVEFDPAAHVVDGTFDPLRQVGTTLTLDRLFACVQTILIGSRRNEFVRKAMLFDALDLLEGLRQGGRDVTLNPTRAAAKLDTLAEGLPPAVASVVLPRCRAAVRALHSVADGFWVQSRRTKEGILLPDKHGNERDVPMNQAVPAYLTVVRNATHGLSRGLRDPRARALFTLHDGSIPSDIPDIALLHLLALLQNPSSIADPAYKS